MGADEATSVTRRSAIGLTGAALALPAAPFQPSYLENRRMPFTPTFVDLVRNFTTTTGTGDFVLGAAVNGFTSFASALQPGDSFYYSAIGVEKPAEREVGRGTLLANGTISREPVSGPKTNFTNGTKTISLIAAAEWFSSVQAGASGGSTLAVVATKAALASASTQVPAILTEAGSEGLFVFDPGDLGAAVTADPRKAIHVAPASDATGASGAWVRKYSGPKPASWFGARGDGATDDAVALQAWLDSGGDLFLPTGEYYSSVTLILRKHVRLTGAGYGFDNRLVDFGLGSIGYGRMPGSRIRFAPGVGGLNIQPQTTLTDPAAVAAAGLGAWTQEGAYCSTIKDIALVGAGTGAAATGLYCRTLIHLENVHVLKFMGKGFDLSASSTVDGEPAGYAEYGNLSESSLRDCHAISNGSHGLHARGWDVNTCVIENFNSFSNGGWGILDESLAGNTYVKPHLANNASGAIKNIRASSSSSFYTPYIEPDVHSNCEIGYPAQVYGADPNNSFGGARPNIYGAGVTRLNQLLFNELTTVSGPAGSLNGEAYLWYHGASGLAIQAQGDNNDITLRNKDGNAALTIPSGTQNVTVHGDLTAAGAVTSSGRYNRADGIWMLLDAGHYTYFAAQGTGHFEFFNADLTSPVLTLDATAAAFSGYVNAASLRIGATEVVSAARAATFASLAASGDVVSTAGKVGYATGAGGTVSQATSKSTTVTLNKSCGQITMNAAALAANTTVTFTLTNSAIAAGDILVLNHVSGGTAGGYTLNAQCGAGSASINVRNVTGASLSEPIVIGFALVKGVTS